MPTPERFRDRTVLITGASAGIGEAAARRFAAEGARLALAARGAGPLEELARELEGQGARVITVPTDVAEPAACHELVERVASELGGIDVLVNNAGYNARGPFSEVSPERLAQTIYVNLVGPTVLMRLSLPHLRQSAAPAIVNVASLAGRLPLPHAAVYSATKFALRALSFALAGELADEGIKVAVVSPGPVETNFILEELDEVPDIVLSRPMTRPEQIAELIADSAADGRPERVPDPIGSTMTTLGYVFPALRRRLIPVMSLLGRRRKQRYQRRGA